jgi:two-component system response regulator FixJ
MVNANSIEPLVYVIDPQVVDRDHTASQLQQVHLESRLFDDIEQLMGGLESSRVGCVLTELKLGGSTAFHLANRLRERNCSTPVILLTSHATVPLTAQAFKGGLFDVVQKPCEPFQLWESVTRAFERHGRELHEIHHRNGIKNRISHLSRQELQVMQMLLDGEPNKRIASQLGLSQRTIVFRRKSLMEKMNAKSVAELACMVHTVTSEALNGSEPFPTSLLDVHVAASICDAAPIFNGHDGGPSWSKVADKRSATRRTG